MGQWEWSAAIGVGFGLGLAAALFVPILIWQMRAYGKLSALRIIGVAATCIYISALVSYTLLPLPSGNLTEWCATNAKGINLTPFQSLRDIQQATAGLGWRERLTSLVLLQVVFNVVLFVPWGVIFRRFFGLGKTVTILSGMATSVLIEGTQYTGIFGLIGCSYRTADVDDLITNTTGVVIGVLIAPLVLMWMPDADYLEAHRAQAREITLGRRLLGQFLDWGYFTLFSAAMSVVAVLPNLFSGTQIETSSITTWVVGYVIPWCAVFVLPLCIGSGASLGQRTVWLEPHWCQNDPAQRGSLWQRIAKGAAGGAGWGLIVTVAVYPGVPDWVGSIRFVFAVVAVAGVVFTKGHRGLSLVLARAALADSRDPGQAIPQTGSCPHCN